MFKAFVHFLGREAVRPVHIVYPVLVGLSLAIVVPDLPLGHPAIYLVPFLLLVVIRTVFRIRTYRQDLLIQLPQERPDPAFVMNRRGDIIAATGKTEALLQRHGITNLRGFFPNEEGDPVNQCLDLPTEGEIRHFSCYSRVAAKWYQVRAKSSNVSDEVLVWFEDITDRKRLDQRLESIRRFSNEIIDSLAQIVEEHDALSRLASMIIDDGYRGVFIATQASDGSLRGYVYVAGSEGLLRSETVEIPPNSRAPILSSRQSKRTVSATVEEVGDRQEFLTRYPVDPRVQEFLGFGIESFVNYHEEDVAIIAFNKAGGIRESDRFAMETMVNTARTVNTLIDLAEANDARFLQSITGLFAAAEFSDEITGKHILRVNRYAELIAEELGLDRPTIRDLGQIAAVHDVGKVAIPHIIKLPRSLTQEERRQMELHTIFGSQIIRRMRQEGQSAEEDPRLELAEIIALHHHQRWDGKGYPGLIGKDGEVVDPVSQDWHRYAGLRPLREEEVPLEARIVSLADKYDALRSARQYKAAMSHDEVCEILFSPEDPPEAVFGQEVANAFRTHHQRFEMIYRELSDALSRSTPRIP